MSPEMLKRELAPLRLACQLSPVADSRICVLVGSGLRDDLGVGLNLAQALN
jgi:hypothetical protein